MPQKALSRVEFLTEQMSHRVGALCVSPFGPRVNPTHILICSVDTFYTFVSNTYPVEPSWVRVLGCG